MLKQNKFVAVIVSLILAFAIVLGVGVALITAGNTGRQMADTDVSTVNDEVTDVTTEEISYVPNDEPRYIVPSEASANKKEIPCTYKTITVGNQTINYIEVLNEAFNSMETAGTTTSYYLGTGIDMSGTGKGFVVRGTVYFDLNGQIISTGADETNTNPLFTVESGGKLIIYDSSDPGYGRNFLIDSDGMYNYNLTRAQASASPYASAGLGLITMCYSKGNGPVINIKSGGYAEFDGGVMGGNYSAAYGGAVYVASGGSFVMNGGSMLGNKAAYGGAIASDGGSVTITGTSTNHVFVSDNIATTNGAGIYTKGALTSSYAVIDGNKCTGGAGGGICAFASLNITGTDISNNSANGSGGGISSSGTPLNIYSSTLYDNTSTTNGGAICATNALFSNGNTIKGNTAQISGGGIYTACVTYLYSTTITRNVSVGDGGGVYIAFATAQPGVKVSGKVEIKENYKGATSILNTSDYSISSITTPATYICLRLAIRKT
jgi:predicted outer membrane repeat protein